jgi:glucose/arabinose dehydrogenase
METLRSRGHRRSFLLLVVLLLLFALLLQDCGRRLDSGRAATASISLVPAAGGFTRPVGIAHAGDGSGRLFIVEQGGLVRIIRNGTVLPTPFLDLSSRLRAATGEQGLLGLAFPPGYGPGRPYLYTNHTGTAGIGDTVISRFTASTDPDQADPATEQTVLTVVQPFANHNGGQLAFGPDGYLYIGMGDGGSAGDPQGNAQNPLSLLGKMLRIDVNVPSGYLVPADNPFVGNAVFRPEIWALGLRNPWRFSFDRVRGDLYIADVGQSSFEEVNFQSGAAMGGANYGWDIMEAMHCFGAAVCDRTGLTLPVMEYGHAEGCSVTGGYVYRGARYPALEGLYLYGDYCSGRIWGLTVPGGEAANRLLLDTGLFISTFGEDEEGNLYVADHAGGTIYRIVSP